MKTLALLGMVIAHSTFLSGNFEYNYLFFFWVAPLLAGLVAINTVNHSKDPKRYGLRLLLWAFISQPVHYWFFGAGLGYLPNVLFGLSLVAFLVPYKDKLKDISAPSWVFYAFYPLHFIVLKCISTLIF